MTKIICIGSACKDIFFPTNEGIVVDTPDDLTAQKKISFELGAKYKIKDRFESLGGVAANVACGLAKMGVSSGSYAMIGNDVSGDWIKRQFEKNGVNAELVVTERDYPSDMSSIVVDIKSGDRVIFSNQKANGELKINPEDLKRSEWVYIGDLAGDWMSKLDKIFEAGTRVAYNPRYTFIRENVRKTIESLKRADVLFINKDESIEIISSVVRDAPAERLYSEDDLNDEIFLIKKLHELGAKVIALTDGERGAWAYDGKNIFHAEARKVAAIDSTGAGDAFSSGFLAGYIKGESLEDCLRRGIVNGAGVVQAYGGVAGLLSEDEIENAAKDIKIEVL